ncbi:MAG: asparagine synthase (glutamine-hydrolyzing) [Myxococcaceae bacterium]
MCGIVGIVAPATDAPLVRKMLFAQAHRGPDGEGLWSTALGNDRRVILGHRRLSILDLSEAGAQPMVDNTGEFVITYNGEIYNYIEVRAELVKLGVLFRSTSDTEVIVEAYKQWGSDCLGRLNGMFAFAIFDRPAGKLFCARDRYGEKPFLFSERPGLFVFASEYKALLQHPEIPLDYDEWRLVRAAHNASTGLDADRQTVFDAVQQLLPGEAMEVDVATLRQRIWRYWKINPGPLREADDERDVFAEFRDLLIDSVRLRLRSDVPVGSCLSGGLDSSAIVCIVRRLLGDDAPYDTFTGRFPGTSADEWKYARQVVDAAGVRSYVVEPGVDRFIVELPAFMWHNELPVGSSSQFAQWCVFHLAKERGVTVLLDGQGADETLGGYEQYFARYVEALRERGDSHRLARELPLIRARYPLALEPPLRALRDKLPFPVRRWLSTHLRIGSNLLYGLTPEAARSVARENAVQRKPGFDSLANALEQDSFGRYLTTLLRYGDRNSMAHSREVRLPFCDHRLAEFVFRLPPHFLMGDVQTKRLLRESMRGILPESIRTRWNKQGFRPPQDQWFSSKHFQVVVRDTLGSRSFRQSTAWAADWWLVAMDRVAQGQLGLGWTIWAPTMIEWWKQHFLAPLRAQRFATASARAVA